GSREHHGRGWLDGPGAAAGRAVHPEWIRQSKRQARTRHRAESGRGESALGRWRALVGMIYSRFRPSAKWTSRTDPVNYTARAPDVSSIIFRWTLQVE